MTLNKLRRVKEGKKIAGVCQGLSEFLGIDPSYIRLGFVLLAFLPPIPFFGMVIIYAILAVVIPEDEGYIDV
ncbi:PspC domain-containing protein [Peptococcus simiae]|uniref:PspC domain-containing protein n=1 Tax=Peptococcus simiae TaxID=1643805 RepID=UPI00397F0AB9